MKRICRFIVSLWLLSFLVFFMSRLAPGDPLTAYYGDRVEKMSVEERWQAEEKLGLHDRIFTQYVRWGRKALQGDFGISYKYKENVLAVIGEKLPNTLLLGGTGFFLVFVCSLFLGAFCAEREENGRTGCFAVLERFPAVSRNFGFPCCSFLYSVSA